MLQWYQLCTFLHNCSWQFSSGVCFILPRCALYHAHHDVLLWCTLHCSRILAAFWSLDTARIKEHDHWAKSTSYAISDATRKYIILEDCLTSGKPYSVHIKLRLTYVLLVQPLSKTHAKWTTRLQSAEYTCSYLVWTTTCKLLAKQTSSVTPFSGAKPFWCSCAKWSWLHWY